MLWGRQFLGRGEQSSRGDEESQTKIAIDRSSPSDYYIARRYSLTERHGYDIMREVDERTAGMIRMGPGTLYGSIKRMLSDGLVEELDERPDPELDDERRRYYRLTDFGYRVATAEAERLAELVKTAKKKKLITART
jgi:DNA-binding PadR family transcriptional regulator